MMVSIRGTLQRECMMLPVCHGYMKKNIKKKTTDKYGGLIGKVT